jgi:hypothetical protein
MANQKPAFYFILVGSSLHKTSLNAEPVGFTPYEDIAILSAQEQMVAHINNNDVDFIIILGVPHDGIFKPRKNPTDLPKSTVFIAEKALTRKGVPKWEKHSLNSFPRIKA